MRQQKDNRDANRICRFHPALPDSRALPSARGHKALGIFHTVKFWSAKRTLLSAKKTLGKNEHVAFFARYVTGGI
jgi:hypothetical protein